MILHGHAFTPDGAMEVARATCARCGKLAGHLVVPGNDWSSADVDGVGWRGPAGRGKVCRCPLVGPAPNALASVARRAVRDRSPVRVVLDGSLVREATPDEVTAHRQGVEVTRQNLDRRGARADERRGVESAADLLQNIINRPTD